MEVERIAEQTLANALGTLIAVAVIYLAGVVVGAISFDLALTVLSAVGVALGGFVAAELGREIDQRRFSRWRKRRRHDD